MSADNVTVSKLLMHPIKGTSMDEVQFTPQGVKYDRNWSIVEAGTNTVLTLREVPELALVHPQIKPDENVAGEGIMTVNFPPDSGVESFEVPLYPNDEILDGWKKINTFKLYHIEMEGFIAPSSEPTSFFSAGKAKTATPSSLLSAFLEKQVHLVFKSPKRRPCDSTSTHPDLVAEVSQQDGYPMLILGEESVAWLEKETRGWVGEQGVEEKWKDEKLIMERFRPNVVLKGAGAFGEDSWAEVVTESADDTDAERGVNPSIALVSKCARCLLPNVDPNTGIRDKAVPYKIMMKTRAGLAPERMRSPCMGVNGVPFWERPNQSGRSCAGDEDGVI